MLQLKLLYSLLILFVTFVYLSVERSAKSLETETEKELMDKLSDNPVNLASTVYDSVTALLNSHSLKVDLSEGSISRSFEEGIIFLIIFFVNS